MLNLKELTLLKAKKSLEKGDFTSTELTESYIENIEQNLKLNAFIYK